MKKPKKILVVDDNQDNRKLVVKVLSKRGYQMVEAVDGEDALSKAVEEMPDLILMDISMPKIDGHEVTKRLKNQNDFKNIPIIAMTAHAMKADKEKALHAGCEDYISKPIDIHELPEKIQYHLKENG